MVEFLQRAGAPTISRCSSAQDHQRSRTPLRLSDGAHTVGNTGTRGQDGETGFAGEFAGGFSCKDRGLLVAHINDWHRGFGFDRAIIDREYMRSREGE